MAITSGAHKKALTGDQKPQKQVLVKIDRVSKKFDETLAVDDVSLTINKGEIFALLGGSGSGKSTLLRMLAGFERPSEGRILLDGVDITDMPPYERPINMMFQSYALFPHMTVAQNIAFGLKQDRLPTAEIDARVEEMLRLVHMTQYAKRRPHQLSGGQRQRVALARALIFAPDIILMDEPLGALDKKLREQMQFEIKRLHEQLGFTVIYVTHDQTEALTMSDRIAVFNNGVVQQCAPPHVLYERPANLFVADFIGESNKLKGVIESVGTETVEVRLDDGAMVSSLKANCTEVGLPTTVSIRPEKLTFTDRLGAAGNQVIADMEARGELSAGVMSAVRKALAADGTP